MQLPIAPHLLCHIKTTWIDQTADPNFVLFWLTCYLAFFGFLPVVGWSAVGFIMLLARPWYLLVCALPPTLMSPNANWEYARNTHVTQCQLEICQDSTAAFGILYSAMLCQWSCLSCIISYFTYPVMCILTV